MKPQTILEKILNFFSNLFGLRPATMFVSVKTETGWERKTVVSPITFSELDERFGEGNWKLS